MSASGEPALGEPNKAYTVRPEWESGRPFSVSKAPSTGFEPTLLAEGKGRAVSAITNLYMLHRGERVLTVEENRAFADFIAPQAGMTWHVPYRGDRVASAEGERTLITGGMHGGTIINNWYDVSNDDIGRELARYGL